MKKTYLINKDDILKAVEIIDKTICSTLGPGGDCVIIERGGRPYVTKDGVSIAKEIGDSDSIINIILKMIAEAAGTVSARVGDGTTSATVIAVEFLEKYLKENDWPISYAIRLNYEKAIKELIKAIKKMSRKANISDLKKVALVSSNNDSEIAKLALDSVRKVGKDGLVLVNYSNTSESSINTYSGYRMNRGLLDTRFSTQQGFTGIYNNPIVLVGTKRIDTLHDIEEHTTLAINTGRPLVIITNAIDDNVVATLAANHVQGNIKIGVISLPGTGQTVRDYAEDIATFCGIKALHDTDSITYNDLIKELSESGSSYETNATKIISNIATTSIIVDKLNNKSKELAKSLVDASKTTEDKSMKDEYKTRANMLLGNVAEIKIGGSTIIERSERYDRLDDTVHALQSAIRSGVVIGGGTTIHKAYETLDSQYKQYTKYIFSAIKDRLAKSSIIADESILDPTESVIHALEAGISAALNLLSARAIIMENVNEQRSNS